MAKMVDNIPDLYGESLVWKSFQNNLADNAIVYNGREVYGREFDFCVLLPNKGILIVEVKGWRADDLKVENKDRIVIDGYTDPVGSPKQQARGYRFALLDKIKKKYATSPLVFDMVCYPLIGKEDYYRKNLNLVSEEEFTILAEDLNDRDKLNKKINAAYSSFSYVGFNDLDADLVTKIRLLFEPEDIIESKIVIRPYSRLIVRNDILSEADVTGIVDDYISGVKYIVFVSEKISFDRIINCIESRFNELGITIAGNDNLSIGEHTKINLKKENEFKIFNFVMYFLNKQICPDDLTVEDGCFDDNKTIVERLSELTPFNFEQFCIEHSSEKKNSLVEAGAGTGKTYSMISRIAFLCNKRGSHVSNLAEEIAMMTFTNDAADNMKTRLKQMFMNYAILTGKEKYHSFIQDVDRANISTIHKFVLAILKEMSLYTGLGVNFKIATDQHARAAIYDRYIEEYVIKKTDENPHFIRELPVQLFDLKDVMMRMAKTLLTKSVDVESIKNTELGESSDYLPYFNDIIQNIIIPAEKEYFEYMHSFNRMDLIECMVLLNRILLNEKQARLNNYKIRYLFIDEFQDTDDVQIDLFIKLQKIIGDECRVFVVGDLKQSIYRFRGAKLSAFDRLKEFSYEWETFHLNRNYRTDKRLLDKYDDIFAVLGQHEWLPYKDSDRLSGIKEFNTEEDELLICINTHRKENDKFYDAIINTVKYQINKTNELLSSDELSLSERTIAILVRNNYQINDVVNEGKKRGLTIDTNAGGDLYRLESTHDLYHLLLAMRNPNNPTFLVNFMNSNYCNIRYNFSLLKNKNEEEQLILLKQVLNDFFIERTKKTWEYFIESAVNQPILYVLKNIFDCLQPWKKYSDSKHLQMRYIANYECLIEDIVSSGRTDALTLNSVCEYLRINIITGQERESRNLENWPKNKPRVLCTTIHKSKGLEYGTVILPFTYEELDNPNKEKLFAAYSKNELSYYLTFRTKEAVWNSNYEKDTQLKEQIDEETRILYVALTRAIRNFIWFKDMDTDPQTSWSTQLEGI